ncbi:MAG TPA: ABC transporter ATP-binding protein [Acidimicrobiia bacterium]|nr:ABC transporter ATP-binding protein [Acidimicrobiia bacterium]
MNRYPITASRLTVRAGSRRLLEDVDLEVAAGEWLGLIGPNGAGKTTLFRALLGQVSSSGKVTIEGASNPNRRQRALALAFVPQRPVLPPMMTVAQYVLLGRTPHISYLRSESDEDLAAVAAAIEALGLHQQKDRELQTLSGGEQQRVILARAIAQEARTLLLDEPTAALDIGHQLSVLTLVDRLRKERGLTVISAIHDLTLAAQFCDRLLLLYRGRVGAKGSALEVLTEGNLSAYYDVRSEVLLDGDGVRAVLPQRTSDEIETPIPPRVSAP